MSIVFCEYAIMKCRAVLVMSLAGAEAPVGISPHHPSLQQSLLAQNLLELQGSV